MKIKVSTPMLGIEEVERATAAIAQGDISGTFGSFIGEFEQSFSKYCGAQYGITTTNGTTALHLAVLVAGVNRGDEVLVATFTNMATFFAVLYQGAVPIPIDIEPDTWNIDPSLLEEKITIRTKAIIVVHIYGHPVDMDPVLEIARKHNLIVIEDCAEAHGAEYKGTRVGVLGDIGCFSFYANKILTTGEGGMLVTNSATMAEKARSLKSLAFGKENKFMHTAVGYNYRMTNVQAAIGVAQLAKIETIIERKRSIADFYTKKFKDIEMLQLPTEKPYAKNVYWMYHVVLRGVPPNVRKHVMQELSEDGIETREAFVPYNMQELFIQNGFTERNACPNANTVAENGFYIPSGPVLTDEELTYVAARVRERLLKI